MRIIALLPLLAACVAESDQTSSFDEDLLLPHEVIRRGLLAEERGLVASVKTAGESDGLWPWFREDVHYLHPGVPVIEGRAAARSFLRTTYTDPRAVTQTLHPETGDVSEDTKLGYTFGWFDEAHRDGSATTYGKYIAAWRRSEGFWKIEAFVRIPGRQQPTPPPADALIFAGTHGIPATSDPATTTSAALSADRAFAATSASQGYTVAFTSFGDDAAVVAGGGEYYWNAAGVAYAFSGWTPAEAILWTPREGGRAASGDLAYTIGTSSYSLNDGTATKTDYSKYLTVWIRKADGSWKWLLDGGNANPPPN